MPRSSRALCLAAAALLLAAAPATAGTVGQEPGVGNVYRAAPGEKNDVTVLDDHLSDNVVWYSIVELGAPLVVNEPCVAGSPAMCPGPFRLYLGDRDDRGRTRSFIHTMYIYGEGGGDTIHTDGERAYAYGGPGADEVRVTAHVGYAFGGTGPDHVYGGAGDYNEVHGDAGDDIVQQASGARCALLYGDGGSDTLLGRSSGCYKARPTGNGGTGPDALIVSSPPGLDSSWLLDGGDGADYIVGGGGGDEITGGTGPDFIQAAADRIADTIACGSGRDTVRADPLDTVAADCELVTVVGA
jgi:Ca2+-binding RTX toxin-like protein